MSKVLVFVHGSGSHPRNYYQATLAGLTELLGAEPETVGVWYSDLLDENHAAERKKELDGDEIANFKAAFSMLVYSDFLALPNHERHNAAFILPAQFLAQLIATDLAQVAEYLFSSKTYGAVQTRMRDGLNKAMGMGDEIVIAGQSLGSVVAFDCLRETAANLNVAPLMTMGSPLSKLRRLNLRTPDLGAIPGNIGEWLNLYDTTDPLANALGPVFPSRPFRVRDVFVDVDSDPIRIHDYFYNQETLAELAAAML